MATTHLPPDPQIYFFSDHSSDYDSDGHSNVHEHSQTSPGVTHSHGIDEEEEEEESEEEDIVTLQNATLENWKINARNTTTRLFVPLQQTEEERKWENKTENIQNHQNSMNANIKIENNNSIIHSHSTCTKPVIPTKTIATPNAYTKAIPMPKTPIMAKNIALSKTTPLRTNTLSQTSNFTALQASGHLANQTPCVSPYQNFATTRLLPGFGLNDLNTGVPSKSFSVRNAPAKTHPIFPGSIKNTQETAKTPTPSNQSLDETKPCLPTWTGPLSKKEQTLQSKPMFLPQSELVSNIPVQDHKTMIKSPPKKAEGKKAPKKQSNKAEQSHILATPERSSTHQFPCEPSPVHKFVPQSPLIDHNDGTGMTPGKSFPKIKPPPFLAKWTKNAQENAAKKTQHMMVLMQQQKEQQNQQSHHETSNSVDETAKDKKRTAETRTQIRNNNLAGIHTQDHPGSCNIPSCPKNTPVVETQPEAIPLDATELLKDVADSSPPTSTALLNNAAQSKWDRIPIGTFRRSRRRSKPHIKVNFAGNASGVLLSGVNKTLFQRSDIELQQEWEDERNIGWNYNYQVVKERKRERKRKLSTVEDIRIMASDPLFDAFQGLWQEGIWDHMDI